MHHVRFLTLPRRGPSLAAMVVVMVVTFIVPSVARGQQEFVRQSLLVNIFEGEDVRLGRAVAGGIRSRIASMHPRRELRVIGSTEVLELVEGSGIEVDRPLPENALRTVARTLRADELVSGRVRRAGNDVVVEARLVLVRDPRLVQPLGPFAARSADAAATLAAEAIHTARRQLVPLRRCENALREGILPQAVEFARQGIAAGTHNVLARTCLLKAFILTGAPATELLKEAELLLAAAPASHHALDAAARALDALGNRARAADMWVRLAATDTLDLDLQRSVIAALLAGDNAARARPLVEHLADYYGEDLSFLRLRWQVLFALRDWTAATLAGERLLASDEMSRRDSTFVLRLATALRAMGQGIRAVAVAADGAGRFPGDARLYAMYSQLVQEEAAATLARGAERFPDAAELHLMRAQELRRGGKGDDAVASLRRALELDPKLSQGQLQLAQSYADKGETDSAYVTTMRALIAGEDSTTVAQFALARGNALYRSANGSRQRADFLAAMRFLALSDTLRASPQARFLLGASALAVSQSAATDAPKDKACDLSRLASSYLPLAREKLTAGASVAPDAARQYLEYLDQLEPVVAKQLETLCGA